MGRFTGILLLTCAAAACAPEVTDEPLEADLAALEGSDGKSDLLSHVVKLTGELDVGYDADILYTSKPRYTAIKFDGTAGDMLEVYVRATVDGGDPKAWLFDDRFRLVGSNDDMSEETKDADISIESLARSGTHYVVFRDNDGATHTFNVSLLKLNRPENAPSSAQVVAVYDAQRAAGTLDDASVDVAALPAMVKGLFNRYLGDLEGVENAQVDAFAFDVSGQTVFLVRKYVPGLALEGAIFAAGGEMLAIGGGDGKSQKFDSWEGF